LEIKAMHLSTYRHPAVLVAVIVLTLGIPTLTSAHHSRSNFDTSTLLEFSGVITEYSWRNPHTFATVVVEDGSGDKQELLFELNSVSVMSRQGWTQDTIQVGDQVTVFANPDNNHDKNLYYSNYWVLPDGSTMVSGGRPPEGVTRQARRQVDSSATSNDFSGIWRAVGGRFGIGGRNDTAAFGGQQISLGGQGTAIGLPLTALGQTEIDAWKVEDNPWFRCVSKTPPWLFSGVGAHRFTRDGDTLTIRHEINDVDRTIHIGLTEHPVDVQASHLGHSIGQFEGETLVVDTAYFTPAQWGIGGGVSSSEQKHLTEWFTLTEDGTRIDYKYTLEDSEYLTEPVTISTQLGLDAGYPFQDEYGCDPTAASRHIVDLESP
jgi:hypothetical protein